MGLLAAACALLGGLPCAWAADSNLEAARAAFRAGQFRQALTLLDHAERSLTKTQDDVEAIHWYRGVSLFALHRREEAAQSLDTLIELSPLHEYARAEAAPDLRGLFQERQERYQERAGVTVGSPTLRDATLSVTLAGHVERVASVVVFVRPRGTVEFRPVEMQLAGEVASGVTGDLAWWEAVAQAGGFEAVVEARNRVGRAVSRLGDALKPFTVDVGEVPRAVTVSVPGGAPGVETPASAPATAPAEETAPAAAEARDSRGLSVIGKAGRVLVGSGLAGCGGAMCLAPALPVHMVWTFVGLPVGESLTRLNSNFTYVSGFVFWGGCAVFPFVVAAAFLSPLVALLSTGLLASGAGCVILE